MQEIGIDLSAPKPQKLTQELANDAALLITMGCGDKCPYVPGLRRDDWPLPDPKGRPMDEVRAVRDDIKARVSSSFRLKDWRRTQRDCSPSYDRRLSSSLFPAFAGPVWYRSTLCAVRPAVFGSD
jgi:hypothetical protein